MGKPEGRAVVQRLASQADVFVANHPAAARKKFGIGYETLAALNDRLIYASFSGYGEKGAEATKPGFEVTAWSARSGLMDTVRASSESVPVRPANGMGDRSAGFTLFSGIMMGLYQRQITGKGTEVSSSLVANGLWANGYIAQAGLCGATFSDRPARELAFNALTNYYKCRDGRWLIFTILNEAKQWPDLMKCLDREDLIDDPRFAKKVDRLIHSKQLIALLDKEFEKHDRAEFRKRLTAAGIVFDVVATPEDIRPTSSCSITTSWCRLPEAKPAPSTARSRYAGWTRCSPGAALGRFRSAHRRRAEGGRVRRRRDRADAGGRRRRLTASDARMLEFPRSDT
jgi:crotonobetainyl-CoA:carnitine CoA-transferase CaiB-like acyl-CoA transferase